MADLQVTRMQSCQGQLHIEAEHPSCNCKLTEGRRWSMQDLKRQLVEVSMSPTRSKAAMQQVASCHAFH